MLPKRFRRARRAVLEIEGARVEAFVADRYRLRLCGLVGLDPAQCVPLLFPRCRSLHTFGMRGGLDVVWLELGNEREGGIRAIARSVEPRRLVRAPRSVPRGRCAALELPAREAERLGLTEGARLTLHLGA